MEIEATFVDSWAAGSGLNCSNSTTRQAHQAGIHINGGSAITIIGGTKIRANTGSGVLISNNSSKDIDISHNSIDSNNFNNDGTESAIDVTAFVNSLTVIGNVGNITTESSGHQRYGLNVSANIYNGIFGPNNFDNNVTGPYNITSPTGSYTFISTPQDSNNSVSILPTVLAGDVTTYQENEPYSPWIIANHAVPNLFRMGFGVNCHWNGTIYQFIYRKNKNRFRKESGQTGGRCCWNSAKSNSQLGGKRGEVLVLGEWEQMGKDLRERLPRHRSQPTNPVHGLTATIDEGIFPKILAQ